MAGEQSASEWHFGDLSGLDDWIEEEDPDLDKRRYVGQWIDWLLDDQEAPPSVEFDPNYPGPPWESREAWLEEPQVSVIYSINRQVRRIDVDYVGSEIPID